MTNKCRRIVTDRTGWHTKRCSNPAKFFEGDEHYCGIHAPSKQAERKAKRGPTWEEIRYQRDKAQREAFAEMLEALRYAVDNPEFCSSEFDIIARAAIAKAEGAA